MENKNVADELKKALSELKARAASELAACEMRGSSTGAEKGLEKLC